MRKSKAAEIRRWILSETGGRVPRLDQLRETKVFEDFSALCGVDTRGRVIKTLREGKMQNAPAQIALGDGGGGISIRDLFEQLCVDKATGEPVGPSFVQNCMFPGAADIYEEGGAMASVDSTMFMGITGQLLITKLLEGYQSEEFIMTKMIPVYESPFEQEKWPGIALPKDPGKNVLRTAEGEPFRTVGFGEEYVQTQLTLKEGVIIPVTKEAIFFDRTGLVTDRASKVGYLLGLSQEKEALGILVGSVTDPILFTEKRQYDSGVWTLDGYQSGVAKATAYKSSGATAGVYNLYTHQLADLQGGTITRPYSYVNDIGANALEDYYAIRTCEQYYSNTVDPNTGEPIVVGKPFVIAPHTKRIDILQILQSENIWKLTQQGFSTAGAIVTTGPQPMNRIGLTADQFAVSRQLHTQLITQLGTTSPYADEIWFYGDVAQALKYVQNWPITVVQAPANSEAEFNADVVLRWKASRRGRYAWEEPRKLQRCNLISAGVTSYSGDI